MGTLMSLLRPEAVLSKIVAGGGQWSVSKPRYGDPAFCLILEGTCALEPTGLDPVELGPGDFALLPEMPGFTLSSRLGLADVKPAFRALDDARYTRHGSESDPVSMRMLGGYFKFDAANAALLVTLLPRVVVIRRAEPGSDRLARLVELIADEAGDDNACRDAVLQRLVEVLLIEALRLHATSPDRMQSGLIAGLSDPVLAPALHRLHADVAHRWTVEELARTAMASRAVFAQRFTQVVGVPPMQYLAHWRVALAMELLRAERLSAAQVAARVGYRSVAAFTTAFARVAGCPPSHFAHRDAS